MEVGDFRNVSGVDVGRKEHELNHTRDVFLNNNIRTVLENKLAHFIVTHQIECQTKY